MNRIYHRFRMQTEKSQSEGKRIMPETRFTELSVDSKVGITLSALETDVGLFFFPVTLKMPNYHSSFLSFMTFYFA